jgi:hypothetical protein
MDQITTTPRNRDKVLLELEVDNPAMIGQLRAAGNVNAQQALGMRWLKIGFASCANAGTVMDTGFVEKQFEKMRQNMVDDFKHQFSLDNADGPVTKLSNQVHQSNDQLAGQLVRAVTESSQKVAGQLSLDDPTSGFARMHGSFQEFQQNVTTILSTGLAAFTTRRQAEAESTLHGRTFQDRALEYLADLAARRGHVFEDVSKRPGLIPRCKTGDGLVKVGPDYFAKGAVIGVEVKEEKGYSVRSMLTETEEMRKNRGTTFGFFVISADYAPPGMAPLMRYGDDIIVAWDADNSATNICLDAALDLACGLATREAAAKDQSIDFAAVDRTINSVEKKATGLGQIFVSATTIRNAADKILDESKPKHAALLEELATLRGLIAALRGSAEPIAPESPPF